MPVRPKQPPTALLHPELGVHVVPVPSKFYDDDDPLVKEYPWAFGTEAELLEAAEGGPATELRESAPIEQATAKPGEKRATRRTKSTKKDAGPTSSGAPKRGTVKSGSPEDKAAAEKGGPLSADAITGPPNPPAAPSEPRTT